MKVPAKRRVFEIIQIGRDHDIASIVFDFFIAFIIFLNLFITLFETFEQSRPYLPLLRSLELITSCIFAVEYMLRIWTAEYLYPRKSRRQARISFMFSFFGIIDLLSFLPYFLPVIFPMGIVTFRMFRVVRIFRLFRINMYYDAFNVITDVLHEKKDQIFSSVCILLILIVASSLFMYSLEHDVQPDKFQNAFSGIWWAASTLLTVGYGDIYPVTTLGKMFGIFITFLGVGMVAIPTGIISAGFVDQYSRIKRISEYGQESDIHFIRLPLSDQDEWTDHTIHQLHLPDRIIVAAIQREYKILVPRGNMMLRAGDVLILGAESFHDPKERIKLKELVLQRSHPWIGERIRDLNISRHSIVVLVKRQKKVLIPNGKMILREGDVVIIYTQAHMSDAEDIDL